MKRMTHEEFQEKVFEALGNKIFIIGRYVNKRTKIKVKCNKCNYIWETNPQTLYNGHGCPRCVGNIKKTIKILKQEIYSLVGDEYTVLGKYINTHTPILFKHNKCGNEFLMSPKAFIHQGQRCPYERYLKSAQSNSEIQGKPEEKNEILNQICNKEGYEIIKGYERANEKLVLKHSKCGEISEIRPYQFIDCGVRCKCENYSKGEKAIREWLKDNNIKFEEQYRFDDCKGKEKRLPFDFAIMSRFNNPILLIEFDGLQHFYPKFGEENLKQIQFTDKIKNDYCKLNKIPLIRIKYNRCIKYENFKNKVIKDLIKAMNDINMTIPSQASWETTRRCRD